LQLSLSTDPVGASYRYLGDHLFGWWLTMGRCPLNSLPHDLHELVRVKMERKFLHYLQNKAPKPRRTVLQVRSRLALTHRMEFTGA
jgi:hypothetical protein